MTVLRKDSVKLCIVTQNINLVYTELRIVIDMPNIVKSFSKIYNLYIFYTPARLL